MVVTPPLDQPFWLMQHGELKLSVLLNAVMVAVVQLVEHQVVILGVAGSSPVSHPYESP